MQNLLVEVNLIRVRLLAHALRAARRAIRSAPLLPILAGARTGGVVHRRWNTDFLRLESALVGLQHDLGVLAFFGGVDHKVVVVGAGHDVLGVAGEDDLELVEDAVVFVRVA